MCVCVIDILYTRHIYIYILCHGAWGVCVWDIMAIAKNSPGAIFKSFSLVGLMVWGPDSMSSSLSSMQAFGIVSFHLRVCI